LKVHAVQNSNPIYKAAALAQESARGIASNVAELAGVAGDAAQVLAEAEGLTTEERKVAAHALQILLSLRTVLYRKAQALRS
jgi:hypothetical protein